MQRRAALKLHKAEFKSLYERLARFNPAALREHTTRRQTLAVSSSGTHSSSLSKEEVVNGAAGQLWSSDGATSVLATASHGPNAPAREKSGMNGTVQQFAADATIATTATRTKEHGYGSKPAEARLRQIIYGTLAENLDVGGLKDDTDLFQYGLDSLQVVSLLNAINASIVKSERPVDLLEREAIYSNPTVAKLVAVIIPPHPIPPSR